MLSKLYEKYMHYTLTFIPTYIASCPYMYVFPTLFSDHTFQPEHYYVEEGEKAAVEVREKSGNYQYCVFHPCDIVLVTSLHIDMNIGTPLL